MTDRELVIHALKHVDEHTPLSVMIVTCRAAAAAVETELIIERAHLESVAAELGVVAHIDDMLAAIQRLKVNAKNARSQAVVDGFAKAIAERNPKKTKRRKR